MKTTKLFSIACGACLLAALPGSSQSFDLSWFTIDAGGGTSTGGVYSLSGTIGQPDAGVMTGGNYTLVGGFWSVAVAVQTEGAPLLSIQNTGGGVVISWPAAASGFFLVETPSLGTPNWSAVDQTVQDNGVTKSVTVPASPAPRFYRLTK